MIAGGKKSQKVAKAERLPKTMALVKAGLSYREIGERLGVSRHLIYKDVKECLRELADKRNDETAEHVELEVARLDEILVGIWAAVRSGDLQAIDRAHRNIELRARILGLLDTSRTIHTGNQAIQINIEVMDDGEPKRIDGTATEVEDAPETGRVLPQPGEGDVVQRSLCGGQIESPVHEAGSESEQTGGTGVPVPEVPGKPSEHHAEDAAPAGGETSAGATVGDIRTPQGREDHHD